ncbi:MAG: hypothetical protein ABR505_08515 [Actinomycetota bacterium]
MGWLRWVVIALAVFEAAYMTIDGGRALITGEYITPSQGEYKGQLGPWTKLVDAVGIAPRSVVMKSIFVAYGVVWLGITAAFSVRLPYSWGLMLAAAIGSLWYLIVGTAASAIIIVLLLLPAVRGP